MSPARKRILKQLAPVCDAAERARIPYVTLRITDLRELLRCMCGGTGWLPTDITDIMPLPLPLRCPRCNREDA